MSTTNAAGKQASITDYPTADDQTLTFGAVDHVDPDGTDARVDRALSECHHVESGSYDTTFRVHSGASDSTYAVDFQSPDGTPFCSCKDNEFCKHLIRAGIENPHLLPGERAATPGGSAERAQRETTRRGSCRSSEDGNESEEIVTDGGEEDDTPEDESHDIERGDEEAPEFPMRDGVPCPYRMGAGIELALRWEIEYEEAKAFLQGIGFYGDAGGDDENAGKELVTDGGQEIHRDYRSGSKLSGELTDEFGSLETHSSSGDRFVVSHEGFMGDKITEMAAKHGFRVAYIGTALVEFTRIEGHHTDPRTDAGEGENAGKEIVTDGGREFDCSVCDAPMEFERVRDGNDGPVVESEEFRCDNGHRGVRNYGPLGHFIQSINLKESSGGKELITDGGIDLPPICPVEPERRNEHDEPICDECGMVVVDRENSEFGGGCLCQGCQDGYRGGLVTDGGCGCGCGENEPPALSVGDVYEGSAGQTVEITDFTGSGAVRYTVRHDSGHPLGSSVTGPRTLRQRLARDGYEKVADGREESESTERDTDTMSGEETAQMLSDALTEYESVEHLYGGTYRVETTHKMLTRADVTDIRAEGFTVAGRIYPHDDGTLEVVVEKVGEGQ